MQRFSVPFVPSDRIAVVGSGIAGLSAAWLLADRYRVTLFEAEHRLGGHTHTVDVTLDGVRAAVDTGFLVFNERTYPNLVALFQHLGVASTASDMSLSVRIESDRIEWSGSSLAGMFAQRRNALRPAFLAMLADIVRFNAHATSLVTRGHEMSGPLAAMLDAHGYGQPFREWYLLPMAGAIWSCPAGRILDFPCGALLRFFHNHGLLRLTDRPRWQTVLGGGREYVTRMARRIADIRLASGVRSIRRHDAGVDVVTREGGVERFQHVVLACHSDQALALMSDADAAERALLGSIRYHPNRAVLHTDARLLPRSRRAWAAWNVHAERAGSGNHPVSLSYLINRLQPLPWRTPVLVTLNPEHEPAPRTVLGEYTYAHPILDTAALAAQRRLDEIQGRRRTWFCGAWTRYGFHEDGLLSGMRVANAFGVRAPWQEAVEDGRPASMGLEPIGTGLRPLEAGA